MKWPTKKQLTDDPMKYIGDTIHLKMKIPTFKDLEHLNTFLMKEYHFEIGGSDDCEDSEEYEKLYYSGDLRSFVGFLWGESNIPSVDSDGFLEFVFMPRYFVGSGSGKDYKYDTGDHSWKEMYWSKIIENSDIIDISQPRN